MMTDQSTPTSSLGEARLGVRLSHNYACDAIYPHPPSPLQECNCGAYRSLLDFEAAARAPYEALVREQAETYHGLVCADRLSNWPTRFEGCPESACRKATAALTRIEESLSAERSEEGGRKDG